MNPQKQTVHVIDFLFTIALLVFFAASALLAVIIGANVYNSTTKNMSSNYDSRTSIAYVTEKLRQHDSTGGVAVADMDGVRCLAFREVYDGDSYTTYIYEHDGRLMELFGNDALPFDPDNGQEIIAVDTFEISEARPGLYNLTIVDTSGFRTQMYISVRSELRADVQGQRPGSEGRLA